MEYIIETERLKLRKIVHDDFNSIKLFLSDVETMYAWEHAFTDEQIREWIDKNIMRYERDGFSYYAVIQKSNNELIGVSGILLEEVEAEEHIGIGYIFNKKYWHNGYAYEAAAACIDYGTNVLDIKTITAQIKYDNDSSKKLAEKLGMSPIKEFDKYYNGKHMTHILYSL